MRILLTGGAGFIGRHVIDALHEEFKQQHEIVIADSFEAVVHGRAVHENPPTSVQGFYTDRVCPVVAGDLTSPVECAKAVMDVGVIVHMAAAVSVSASTHSPHRFVHHNDGATALLWEAILTEAALRQVPIPAFVNFSSMSVYGEGMLQNAITEDFDRTPLNIYAQTKHQAERISELMALAHRSPLTNIRLFNAYGPGQSLGNAETGVVAIWMAQALQGQMPVVYEDGLQRRDFVYVADIARAVALIVKNRIDDTLRIVGVDHVNIGSGKWAAVLRVAELISLMTGAPLPVPNGISRFGDSRSCYPSIEHAKHRYGWTPKVSLTEGLRATYEWAKHQMPR